MMQTNNLSSNSMEVVKLFSLNTNNPYPLKIHFLKRMILISHCIIMNGWTQWHLTYLRDILLTLRLYKLPILTHTHGTTGRLQDMLLLYISKMISMRQVFTNHIYYFRAFWL